MDKDQGGQKRSDEGAEFLSSFMIELVVADLT